MPPFALVHFTYNDINLTSFAESNFRWTYFVEHRGILSVVTKKAVVSRTKGVEVMAIRINKLVGTLLSKMAHPSNANPEVFQKSELARAKAWRDACLNGGSL